MRSRLLGTTGICWDSLPLSLVPWNPLGSGHGHNACSL